MTLALCLLLLSAAPESRPRSGPSASQMAILYFMAGDMRRAVDSARTGMKTDAAKCKVLLPLLVEYQFLVSRRDELTIEEAKSFIAWDRQISPKASGKLTALVYRKYVETPLQYARTANQGGDRGAAKKLLEQALTVDPTSDAALALKALIEQSDGGRQ